MTWKSMRQLLYSILFLFLLSSCGQDYNSSSNDTRYRSSSTTTNSDPSNPFGAAQAVLSDKCITCHGGWASYTDSSAWVNSGYISPGNWNSSIIHNKIKNYGGDMPPAPASDLTTTELQALETWVNSL